jgi:5'-methylthioadenosine phosphorylase
MADGVRIGIIGGSGLGEVLHGEMNARDVRTHDVDTPFGKPSAAIVTGAIGDVPVALLQRHGVGHVFNPTTVPYRANIFALKALGCTHIVATGATGSLREEVRIGELVLCDQLIDRTVSRPRTFFEHSAVHVEFADPFCPVMRQWLLHVAADMRGVAVHERGCYVCIEGPSFSTIAESHVHRSLGADVVGMTALPEARLAREAEIAYALLALPTDYDCWRPRSRPRKGKGKVPNDAESLLNQVIANLNRLTQSAITLISEALRDVSLLHSTRSPAHDALKLAIWSDKQRIDRAEIDRLAPLWSRHFV